MADLATDVPGKFDVVLNGHGYILSNTVDQSLPFRVQRAEYTYSPTFVERTNVQGDYGDNQQDFWLTWTQRDWSPGEQQKFYRTPNRFWRGDKVDVRTAGQVTMRPPVTSTAFAAAVSACAPRANQTVSRNIAALSATNLYHVNEGGAITDAGAHGLGATPSTFGFTSDGGGDMYFSTTAAGTVGVRKWDGTVFSTFSATSANSLAYLNNALYGLDGSSLNTYSTGGVASTLFTWRQADGTASLYTRPGRIKAFGSRLVMTWVGMQNELWQYDGTATNLIARFPVNVAIHDVEEVYGVLFISANILRSGVTVRPVIFYYQNGSLGLLWQADDTLTAGTSTNNYAPALTSFDGGLVFTDDTTGRLMFYDLAKGAFHAIGAYTVTDAPGLLASSIYFMLHTRNQTTGYYFPGSGTTSSSSVTTSLVDFDSSLDKIFRGIKVDFDEASDGDGGSVDIAYRVGDVDGAYTTLQTGAVSGTEYTLSGVTGRSVTVKVTLNKGTSTNGPKLKRIYLRAAPLQQTFKRRRYIFDVSGRDGKNHVVLRDNTNCARDGRTMADELVVSAVSSTPFTVTDRFGSFTAVVEPDSFRLVEVRPDEFLADVMVREV